MIFLSAFSKSLKSFSIQPVSSGLSWDLATLVVKPDMVNRKVVVICQELVASFS
jgi:hypothetical protein